MSNFIRVNFKDGGSYISHKKRLGLDVALSPETGEALFYAIGNQITREEYDRLCKEVGASKALIMIPDRMHDNGDIAGTSEMSEGSWEELKL